MLSTLLVTQGRLIPGAKWMENALSMSGLLVSVLYEYP
jgi:hypothetical protein